MQRVDNTSCGRWPPDDWEGLEHANVTVRMRRSVSLAACLAPEKGIDAGSISECRTGWLPDLGELWLSRPPPS